MCRILIGKKLLNAGAVKEPCQRLLVFVTPRSTGKTCPKFTENDKWNHDFSGPPDHMHSLRCPFTKILITIAVHQNSHFQSSSSMDSKASMAASKSGSATQDPANSSRS